MRQVKSEDDLNLEQATSIIGGSIYDGEEGGDENITQEDLETKSFKNENNVFTFSLPFGGNPLSHLPSLRQLTRTLPIIGNIDAEREEIRNRLKKQQSITTLEEALLYKNSKGIDNSRIRAMRRALTPSISIPSLGDDKKKFEPTVWDEIDGDIVILGGYRGSILRETKTKRRVWIPIRAGFNIRKIDLLIGPTDADEAKAQEEIYSDDMMCHLGPVDISRRLKAKLSNGKTNVHTFGYDWRLSPDISSQQLYEFLKGLDCNKKGKKGAIVIAHSMGGVIAHHAMQKNPELFRGLIYVGVPAMCPNILGPLRFGDNVLFSSKILTPEVNFFMRSSFVFLPKDGRCFIDRETDEQYNLDFFDVETWKEYNLSPLVSKERSGVFVTSYEESVEYLERTLKRTRKFVDELVCDPEKKYPPMAIVYGNEVPTVRGCRVNGPEGIKMGDYEDFYYGPGDGVVHHKWLMPERYNFPVVAKFASPLGHISLMTDLPVMAEALSAVLSEGRGE